VEQLVAGLLELPRRRADCRGVRDVELDADLRHGPLNWPLRRPEARLGGLGQRPDTEGLAAGDLLAVVIVGAVALERQPKRLDVQLAAGRRIGRNHRHGRKELNVHATSSLPRSTIRAVAPAAQHLEARAMLSASSIMSRLAPPPALLASALSGAGDE